MLFRSGQGYRNPSINEKYLRKDIGGVGVYPNLDIKPEKGFNAEKSTPDSYVITYSDAKILSNTGVLTVQNRNDFDITVHLLCEGKQELVSDSIPAGGCYSFQNVTDKEYTVGIHAEVDENTDIKAFVYDGKDTEPYTR